MATDALLTLQASVTKAATFTGTPLILAAGTPRRNLYARVNYSAATNASGSNSVTFALQVSRDGGSTFNTEFSADPIALSTAAQSGEIAIPFDISPASVVNGTQVQLVATFTGAGTTPTITYSAAIQLGRP
jgi:hypothetical protein